MRTSRRHPRALVRAAFLCLALTALVPSSAPAVGPPAGTLTLGGVPCSLIPVVPLEGLPGGLASTGACPGVRPGALVRSSKGMCTLNFLFAGSNGARYIGTAGHCILGDGPFAEDVGEKKWSYGRGPVAKDARGKRIGEFAYAILKSPKDFALIRLDKSVSASAQMCYFGGPTGTNTSSTAPVVLHHFGQGLAIGHVLPARSGVATSMSHKDHVYASGFALPGDSGSGVISSDGRAVGVLVTAGAHVGSRALDAGFIGITRIAPQEARAEKVLGIRLTLKTARRISH